MASEVSPSNTPRDKDEAQHRFLELQITSQLEDDFIVPSASTMNQVMDFILDMDAHHASRNRCRNVASRIEPLVKFIERYSKAIDSLVQCTDGSVLSPIALIWGGLRVVLEISSSMTKYFPKLVDLLQKLGSSVAVYGRYDDLFGQNAHFKAALNDVYSQILNILLRAYKTFKKKARMILLRSIWATFESDFNDRLERLSHLMGTLEQETTFSHRNIVQGAIRDFQLQNEVRHWVWTLDEIQEARKPVLKWLSPIDAESQLIRLSSIATSGTGAWLLGSSSFRAWEADILESKSIVAFHFCDRLRDDFDDETSMFKSIVAQLCIQAEILPSCLLQAFETAQRFGRNQITSADLPASLLQYILTASQTTFLVIDGLDELRDASRLFTLVHDCLLLSSNLHIIVLSRETDELRKAMSSWPTITLGISNTQADIRKFVSNAAKRLPVDDLRFKDTVVQRVIDRSGGMFLWANLAMNALSHATSPAHLLNLTEQIPNGVSAIYLQHLRGILTNDGYTQRLVIKVLRCVCCSRRPLCWRELQFAVSYNHASAQDGTLANDSPFRNPLTSLVSNLVVYDQEKDEFNFPHLSVREFLLRLPEQSEESSCVQKFFVNEESAAADLAAACLYCLNMTNEDEVAFTRYATPFWIDHVLDAPWSNELHKEVQSFLLQDDRRQKWLSEILFLHRPGFPLQDIIQQRDQLIGWLANGRAPFLSQPLPTVLDWIEDILSILLRNYDDIEAVGTQRSISYFERLMIFRDLSRLLTQSKKTGIAITKLEQYREERFLETDPSTVWVLNVLGILYDQQGESAKSISLHKAALAIQESVFSPDHLETTWTVNELGRMYRHVGDASLAAEHHLRALRVLRKSLAPDHLEIVWTENTLARAERKLGRPATALKLHTKAYETRRHVLGQLHPHTLWVLGDIAQCHRDLGELDEAIRSHRLAIAGRTKALGSKHPDTLWSANDLGVVLAESGQLAEALALQSSVLPLQSEVLGTAHGHTEWTRKEIDRLAVNMNVAGVNCG
ncbi:hypothetical protein PG984_013100 [Apiospora sp. TS-2023a]